MHKYVVLLRRNSVHTAPSKASAISKFGGVEIVMLAPPVLPVPAFVVPCRLGFSYYQLVANILLTLLVGQMNKSVHLSQLIRHGHQASPESFADTKHH